MILLFYILVFALIVHSALHLHLKNKNYKKPVELKILKEEDDEKS